MKKYLIVGLGNIGQPYEHTRHNIGFKVLDYFAEQENLTFEVAKLANKTTYSIKGRLLILIKPNTFMNLSGKAILYWQNKENIPLENILVITDDLNLPFGSLRLKTKGSSGGHNGLKDTQLKLQTTNYARLRFGISDSFSKGNQVDYVLSNWTEDETIKLPERLEQCSKIIKSFALEGAQHTMSAFNGK